jgi:hypothetical protein
MVFQVAYLDNKLRCCDAAVKNKYFYKSAVTPSKYFKVFLALLILMPLLYPIL